MVNKNVTRVKQFLSLCSSMYIGFVRLLIFKIFLCEINYDDDGSGRPHPPNKLYIVGKGI